MVQSLKTVYYDGVIDQKSNLTLIAGGASRIVDSTGAVFVHEGKQWKKLKHHENFEFVDARTGEKYKVTYECKEGKEASTTCTVTKPSCFSSSSCTSTCSSSSDCCVCPTGPTGPRGPTGFTGRTGPTGPTTPPEAGFVYNNVTNPTIGVGPTGEPIPFNNSFVSLIGAVTFTPPDTIVIGTPGIYSVSFTVRASDTAGPAAQFFVGLKLNGASVSGSLCISTTDNINNVEVTTGTVLVNVPLASSTLQLINYGPDPIILQGLIGPPAAALEVSNGAILTVERIA